MKLIIDTDEKTLSCMESGSCDILPLYSKKAFELISKQWLKVGWNEKYAYTFSWFGRPIIQLPEDMLRIQEVIYRLKPDVIIETGVAHGGSLIYYASLCKAIGKGRVIGIDIEIRQHNRKAIEEHELFEYITLFEGNSVDQQLLLQVQSQIKKDETVLIILDSCHTKEHVLKELEAYSPLVTKDSYIVATDGIMKDLYDTPRGEEQWINDNPTQAALEFVMNHQDFVIEQPLWPFNESRLEDNLTHWPGAWIRKK